MELKEQIQELLYKAYQLIQQGTIDGDSVLECDDAMADMDVAYETLRDSVDYYLD